VSAWPAVVLRVLRALAVAGPEPELMSVLENELEKRIAWFIINFSSWDSEETVTFGADGEIATIDIVMNPSEDGLDFVREQGFASVGMLSSLYAALFNSATLSSEGKVDALDHEPIAFGAVDCPQKAL
jgi:hypothetical protein